MGPNRRRPQSAPTISTIAVRGRQVARACSCGVFFFLTQKNKNHRSRRDFAAVWHKGYERQKYAPFFSKNTRTRTRTRTYTHTHTRIDTQSPIDRRLRGSITVRTPAVCDSRRTVSVAGVSL
jgi:hypothetical protein